MNRFAVDTLSAFWQIMLDSSVWLIVGLLLAGIVHAFIPAGFLARHLATQPGRSAFWPIARASLLGIPLPLCSCSVIPVAAGLRRSGAGRGASAAFAISTPQTGEESVPLTWALFGPVFALARPVIAVATALAAGLLIERFTNERTPTPVPPESPAPPCCSGSGAVHAARDARQTVPEPTGSCCSLDILGSPTPPAQPARSDAGASCCGSTPPPVPTRSCCADASEGDASVGDRAPRPGLGARTTTALRHGFVTMLLDLAPWLAVGLGLSAVIAALVPDGWIAEHVGTGIGPMLLMLVVGLPLYVCATSTTPLAFALVAAGLSPGAALVLLLAGPATNTATMSWVIKDLGVRALGVYLLVIAAFAVGAGLLFDAGLSGMVRLAHTAHTHDHSALGVFQAAGAVVFTVLLGIAVAVRLARFVRRSISSGG